MRKRTACFLAGSALVPITLLDSVSPASAAPAAPAATHCLTNVSTGEYKCFTSRREVVKHMTRGKVTDIDHNGAFTSDEVHRINAATGGQTLMPKAEKAVAAITTGSYVPAATLFKDINYGSWSWDLTAYNGCDGYSDVDHWQDTFPSQWNDITSSFAGYNGCDTKLYAAAYQGGAYYGPYYRSSWVAELNDRASSLTLH